MEGTFSLHVANEVFDNPLQTPWVAAKNDECGIKM